MWEGSWLAVESGGGEWMQGAGGVERNRGDRDGKLDLPC